MHPRKHLRGVTELNIFLTGATGFLGGKLIHQLIENQNNHLFVLARNPQKANALLETIAPQEQHKITIIQGDITHERCGISPEDSMLLQNNIDIVYHLAALVKFDIDLRDQLFQINYEGTKHVLQLAEFAGAKSFFHISTAYTVGKNLVGKEALYGLDTVWNNPYEESKAKAEHLVFSYKDQMDISIFRPAIIVGDSKTGEADSNFTLYGFMRALEVFKRKVLRKANGAGKQYRLVASKLGTSNFVPVDYVADILALAAQKAEKNTVYNITNPNPPTNQEILMMLKDALDFEQLSVVEDYKAYELSAEEQQLNQMVQVFLVYLETHITFYDDNTQALLEGTDINHLHMSPETVQMIVEAYKS